MEAGTTWYLNGEDSLDLTFEKEVKANGVTEHKHYLGLGSMSFALYTKRTGTLPAGTAAQNTSYLHNDHLGSLAAISNEAGALTERLAYDPWGKRRNTNGQRDPLALLAGKTTSRGFTLHEHLDEVGVIHMNGRVNDPLIGRFMSADTYVQAPYNLKSFNRYSYGWNNPLRLVDPTGYFSWSVGGTKDSPNSGTTNTYGNTDGTTSNYGCSSCGSHSPSSPSYQAPAGDYSNGNSGTGNRGNVRKPAAGGGSVGGNVGAGMPGPAGPTTPAPDKPKPPNKPNQPTTPVGAGTVAVSIPAPAVGSWSIGSWLSGLATTIRTASVALTAATYSRGLNEGEDEWVAERRRERDAAAQNALSANAAGDAGVGANSGDKDPSTPTGQRGSPIEVKPGTNEPTSIDGRDYSGHALDRMQGRGVPPSAVEDAIQNGTPSPGNTPGTTVHTGSNGVTVVTGNGGRVVTVIPR